jgi:hypothetical protein
MTIPRACIVPVHHAPGEKAIPGTSRCSRHTRTSWHRRAVHAEGLTRIPSTWPIAP